MPFHPETNSLGSYSNTIVSITFAWSQIIREGQKDKIWRMFMHKHTHPALRCSVILYASECLLPFLHKSSFVPFFNTAAYAPAWKSSTFPHSCPSSPKYLLRSRLLWQQQHWNTSSAEPRKNLGFKPDMASTPASGNGTTSQTCTQSNFQNRQAL